MSAAPPATAAKTLGQLRAEKRAAATVASRRPAAGVPPPPPADSPFQAIERVGADTLKFRLGPTHVSYANTLRRAMITEVETVAFRADIQQDGSTSDVNITQNSTPMSNEMLAHRIGLVPIFVQDPLNWNPDKYSFKLDVVNDSGDPRDITASDIEVYENRGPEEEPLRIDNKRFFRPAPQTRSASHPDGDTCLLTVLKGKVAGQDAERLTFTAKATVGTGRQNARFMPVTSRCAYGYTLDEDPARRKEFFTRWLQSHKKVNPAELEADSEKKAAMEREFATMEVQRCYKVDARGEPYSYDFTVESVGVLAPAYVVGRALAVLQAKLLRFASIDSGDLPETLRVLPADARMKGFDFIFTGEDHTLGNLLQTWLDQNMLDNGEITFTGYKVPHPLRDEMVLRIGVADGKDTTARAALAKASRELAQMFRNWGTAWAAATTATS